MMDASIEEICDILNAAKELRPDEMSVGDKILYLNAFMQFAEKMKPLVAKYSDKLPKETTFLFKM